MLAIRCRTGVVGENPDGKSAAMVVGVRLGQVVSTHWETREYMSMDWLKHADITA